MMCACTDTVLKIALARAANSQPSFDFLTGAESGRPPSRDTFRNSSRIPSGGAPRDESAVESDQDREKRRREMDELKAEIKTLRYTIDNHKQEEELGKLRHESELRDARRKAEDDFNKKQAAEAEKSKAVRLYEAAQKEVTELKDAAASEKAVLERRLRENEESKRSLEEELEEIKSEREETVRGVERKAAELETRNATLQKTVDGLLEDSDNREALLKDAQQKLADKETACGTLEAEILRLKAQGGDADTLGVIKRELSEQVAHIRKLEVTNREQAAEIKHLKQIHKSVEVVEEEKRSLQRKLDATEVLENELGEARIQRQRLEDERLAWTAYLQSEAGSDGQLEFDSPEALAKALVAERLQTATLVERIGRIEPELSSKDSIIQSLEADKSKLAAEIEKVRSSGGSGNSKAQLRLERQRALAVKEAEYLRAQLTALDSDDTIFQPEGVDKSNRQRIQELEDMVDRYRQEVQTLHGEIATRETQPVPAPEATGTKRPRDDSEDNERMGQYARKIRKLQDELTSLQTSNKLLQKELSVTKERLTSASKTSKTRILSLRSNPTSDHEAIKQSTLEALRQENADLLAQLKGSGPITTVPASALTASQRATKAAEKALASEQTRNDRLLKVWGNKTAEFRELVISLLGWDLVFMKNGKTRVTSHFYPSKDGDENSIVFDGENGTMKISGGPESAFAVKIADQIKFWAKEKGSIPCFLAALTLEFFDEANKDGTLRVDV